MGAVCVREGQVLLVHRAREPSAGLWSVPGGRVHPGEPLADAVVRELREETSLTGTVTGLCGVTEDIADTHHFVILDYWVSAADGVAQAADDAAAVTWADRADLDRLDLVPGLLDFFAEHGVLAQLR